MARLTLVFEDVVVDGKPSVRVFWKPAPPRGSSGTTAESIASMVEELLTDFDEIAARGAGGQPPQTVN